MMEEKTCTHGTGKDVRVLTNLIKEEARAADHAGLEGLFQKK
jgi:hypothetical protein